MSVDLTVGVDLPLGLRGLDETFSVSYDTQGGSSFETSFTVGGDPPSPPLVPDPPSVPPAPPEPPSLPLVETCLNCPGTCYWMQARPTRPRNPQPAPHFARTRSA